MKEIKQSGFTAAELPYGRLIESGVSGHNIGITGLELGLRLSLHCSPFKNTPPYSENHLIDISYTQIARIFEFASIVKADTVVINPGKLDFPVTGHDDDMKRLFELLFYLDTLAAAHDIWIALEGIKPERNRNSGDYEGLSFVMDNAWNRIKYALDCPSMPTLEDMFDSVPFGRIHYIHLYAGFTREAGCMPENAVLETLSYYYDGYVVFKDRLQSGNFHLNNHHKTWDSHSVLSH
ncbi:MAG: hypothetical protein JW881_02450 [Spirochaetales bacterium]|nr:hypothetical protein [Spirochaetales bacterium]